MKLARLPRPVALVLTGGTARAAAQAGMMRALDEVGMSFDLIVGSSTGAINGAVAAADPHFVFEQLQPLWTAMADDSSLSSPWRNAFRGISRRQTLRTQTVLRAHLTGLLADLTFDQLPIPLTVMATDLNTGRAVALESGSVVEALIASCAFPVLMPPVETTLGLLVDGSITAAAPASQAWHRGAGSVVLLDTGAATVSEEEVTDARWYSVMGFALEHLIRGQAAHDLAEVGRELPVVVISFREGSPFGLKEAASLIEPGYETARAAISSLEQQLAAKRVFRKGIYGATGSLSRDERLIPLLR